VATLGLIGEARTALLRVGLHTVDARSELGAYLRGDVVAASHALELLDLIEQGLATAQAIVRRLAGEDEPWTRL
jgi:hypothetical protein